MRRTLRFATPLLCFLIMAAPAGCFAQAKAAPRTPDVIYVPTPPEVVEEMLKLADVKKGDVLYDLGSGDGRIAVAAAKKYGIRAVGIDIDPQRIREANENAKKAGVEDLVKFRNEDLFKADFREATVVTLYLLPDLNVKLRPRLWNELKPGTRIVSHDGGIADWPADETLEMRTPEKPVGVGGRSKVELWIVPANAAGAWSSELPSHGGAWRFRIDQHYQVLEAKVSTEGRDLLVRNSRLRGEEIKLIVTGVVGPRPWHHYFVGTVRGDRIDGQLTVSNGTNVRTLPWVATRSALK